MRRERSGIRGGDQQTKAMLPHLNVIQYRWYYIIIFTACDRFARSIRMVRVDGEIKNNNNNIIGFYDSDLHFSDFRFIKKHNINLSVSAIYHPPQLSQLIQSADGLSQVQQQQQQTQPMSISMDQFQTVTAAMPQYMENPFLTAAGTTQQQQQQPNMLQWPTAYRHAAPTIDVRINI